MQTLTTKRALNPATDFGRIRDLRRIAIAHRRRLLTLGHDLGIRLHYGAAMSAVEILTYLYQYWMRIDPEVPGWGERDRFILSKGHAAPGLYVALSLRGYFPDAEFTSFRRLHSILQGHPDRNKTPGVDCSTGSLGQGLGVACGMALSAKMAGADFRSYVLLSDGECNEGSVWEAALIAANLRLGGLIALLDWNGKSSYGLMKGRNEVAPLADKWRAFGWAVFECDGHDFVSISAALAQATTLPEQPAIVLCRTMKGKGIPHAEVNRTPSNFALTDAQYAEALSYLDAQEAALDDDRAR